MFAAKLYNSNYNGNNKNNSSSRAATTTYKKVWFHHDTLVLQTNNRKKNTKTKIKTVFLNILNRSITRSFKKKTTYSVVQIDQ